MKQQIINNNSSSGAIYGIGIFGALVYFLQHASSFWDGVVGVLYAIFWPAVMVYKVFELFKM